MGNVTWRISKRKTRQRRSANLKLKQSLNLSECPNCHHKKMPHRVCPNCGYYDGRDVLHSAE